MSFEITRSTFNPWAGVSGLENRTFIKGVELLDSFRLTAAEAWDGLKETITALPFGNSTQSIQRFSTQNSQGNDTGSPLLSLGVMAIVAGAYLLGARTLPPRQVLRGFAVGVAALAGCITFTSDNPMPDAGLPNICNLDENSTPEQILRAQNAALEALANVPTDYPLNSFKLGPGSTEISRNPGEPIKYCVDDSLARYVGAEPNLPEGIDRPKFSVKGAEEPGTLVKPNGGLSFSIESITLAGAREGHYSPGVKFNVNGKTDPYIARLSGNLHVKFYVAPPNSENFYGFPQFSPDSFTNNPGEKYSGAFSQFLSEKVFCDRSSTDSFDFKTLKMPLVDAVLPGSLLSVSQDKPVNREGSEFGEGLYQEVVYGQMLNGACQAQPKFITSLKQIDPSEQQKDFVIDLIEGDEARHERTLKASFSLIQGAKKVVFCGNIPKGTVDVAYYGNDNNGKPTQYLQGDQDILKETKCETKVAVIIGNR